MAGYEAAATFDPYMVDGEEDEKSASVKEEPEDEWTWDSNEWWSWEGWEWVKEEESDKEDQLPPPPPPPPPTIGIFVCEHGRHHPLDGMMAVMARARASAAKESSVSTEVGTGTTATMLGGSRST